MADPLVDRVLFKILWWLTDKRRLVSDRRFVRLTDWYAERRRSNG